MAMKSIKYSLLLLGILLLQSCQGFLGNVPKGYQIPETVQDYELILNDENLIYYGAKDLDLMTDEAYIPADLPQEYVQINLGNMKPAWRNMYLFADKFYSEDESDFIYEQGYARIFTYNAIIEGLKSAEGDEAYRERIKAEALASRAFEYLLLVTVYAPPYLQERASQTAAIPLILTDDISIKHPPLATQEEVYEQIFSDLESAIPYLPDKAEPTNYRMSKGAARAIYARAAFFTHQYDLALEQALQALQANDNLLDMKPLTLNENEWAVGGRNDYPEALDNPESILIRHLTPQLGLSEYLLLGHHMPALYGEEPKEDMRYALFITDIPGGWADGNPPGELTWDPAVEFNVGLSTPELYLMAAECEARAGKLASALERLNKLRSQRIKNYSPLSITDQDRLIREIINERQREYLFRGFFRFMELKRLATDSKYAVTVTHYDVDGNPVVSDPTSPKYLYHPLPSKVLSFWK